MRRSLPLLLVATGLAVFVGGFVYDVRLAGIPNQDPTPAMVTDYAHHSRVASLIRSAGGVVVLTGVTAALARRLARRAA